jgi:hypothetical protein
MVVAVVAVLAVIYWRLMVGWCKYNHVHSGYITITGYAAEMMHLHPGDYIQVDLFAAKSERRRIRKLESDQQFDLLRVYLD